MQFTDKKIHLIGIGGCGMRALASLLLAHGAKITGSDAIDSVYLKVLREQGAYCWVGHNPDKIDSDVELAVISSAIDQNNPELIKLTENNCEILKYAQMLGLLMNLYRGVAISGTHGKTTTSAMVAYIMQQANLDPSFVIGANVDQLSGGSGVGTGKFFIAEACEFDRSLLNLNPEFAVILNIEEDHLDYYSGLDEILEVFNKFATQVKDAGKLILNGDDPNIKKYINTKSNSETFGLSDSSDWRAGNIKLRDGSYSFEVYHKSENLGTCSLMIPGKHNLYNALAAIAICRNCGVLPCDIFSALAKFQGAFRRLTLKGSAAQITIIDDYAHHPTEIQATLQAVREKYNPEKLWCIFQPHQHSRTRFLIEDFAKSFQDADVVILPDIYFVRDSETEKQLINSGDLVSKISITGGTACYLPRFDQIVQYLKSQISQGDLIITMGAGDIWKVADELVKWIGRDNN